ncbi:MAG: MOSC domain-containing protein [Acidobacteria bacterium]|nr:MOSC domain-containing protein [Acidobacteriota bacterium]
MAEPMGAIERIFLRPSARTPVREVRNTTAVAGAGLTGDHAGGGNRQVTLLDATAWEAACAELGRELSPGARRANLVTSGVDLAVAIGRGLRIGGCLIRVVAETRPCRLMDDAAQGLQRALDPDCRGGVYGRVLEGGEIAVGAVVEVVDLVSEPVQESLPLAGVAS